MDVTGARAGTHTRVIFEIPFSAAAVGYRYRWPGILRGKASRIFVCTCGRRVDTCSIWVTYQFSRNRFSLSIAREVDRKIWRLEGFVRGK